MTCGPPNGVPILLGCSVAGARWNLYAHRQGEWKIVEPVVVYTRTRSKVLPRHRKKRLRLSQPVGMYTPIKDESVKFRDFQFLTCGPRPSPLRFSPRSPCPSPSVLNQPPYAKGLPAMGSDIDQLTFISPPSLCLTLRRRLLREWRMNCRRWTLPVCINNIVPTKGKATCVYRTTRELLCGIQGTVGIS